MLFPEILRLGEQIEYQGNIVLAYLEKNHLVYDTGAENALI